MDPLNLEGWGLRGTGLKLKLRVIRKLETYPSVASFRSGMAT